MARRKRDLDAHDESLAIVTGPLAAAIAAIDGDSLVPGGVDDPPARGARQLIVPRFYFDDDRDRVVRLPKALEYGHRVDVLEICLPLFGSPLVVVEGRVYRLREHRMAILPPGYRHFESCGHRARSYELVWIIARPGDSALHVSTWSGREGYGVRAHVALGPAGDTVGDIIRLTTRAAEDPGAILPLKTALLTFAARAAGNLSGGVRAGTSGSIRTAVERAGEYIRRNYRRRLSLADVAEAAHLTPNYLSMVFKEATGRTVLEEIHRLTLIDARARLERTDDPIKAIAADLGFESAHYFSRFIRKMTGRPPSALRDPS